MIQDQCPNKRCPNINSPSSSETFNRSDEHNNVTLPKPPSSSIDTSPLEHQTPKQQSTSIMNLSNNLNVTTAIDVSSIDITNNQTVITYSRSPVDNLIITSPCSNVVPKYPYLNSSGK